MDLTEKLKKIELLLLDVDGVLTDGSINYDNTGNEIKTFNSKDGLGLRLLMDAGVKVGIITGRSSEALLHRCRNLKIDNVFDRIEDKTKALNEILEKFGLNPENAAFVGDDLPDIPVMLRVGVAFAVNDAVYDVKKISHLITAERGGRGAVREVCEKILDAKDLLEGIRNRYLK